MAPKRRNTDTPVHLSGWEAFHKYVGIQGVLAFMLVLGYIIATLTGIDLPGNYLNLTYGIIGFYFAKNGVSLLDAIRR